MAALRPVAPSGGDDAGAVDHGFQGLYFALAAAALFSTCDACIKWLSSSFSLFQIIFFNALWSSIPLAVLIIRASGNGPWLYTRRMPRHLARVAFGAMSALCAFYAFSKMPLADAYAIAFSGPLFITALAVPILGEQVGWRRWTAVTVGFIGVLVMLNPSNGTISLASLSVLFSAACYGFSATLLRSLCRTENTVLLLFIPNAIIVVVTGAIQPFVWVTPSFGELLLLSLAGLVSGIGQLCQIMAFSRAPAAAVAPFQYTQMFWAVAYGYLIWGNLPGYSVLLGAPIVIASGLYILYRETVLRRQGS